MWTCFVLVVVVPGVAATAWGVYSYRKFRRTPAAQWRTRILQRAGELKREYQAVRAAGRPADHTAVERRLFAEHLASIPTAAVEQFAGIGPGTVDRLRGAGLRSLADLVDYPFHTLSGFGPSRTADVRAAVKQLLAEALRRFAAGDCPKGREFRQYVQRADQRAREEAAVRDAKLGAISAELDALKSDVRLAETITWSRFLRHDGELPGVPDESRRPPVARRDDRGHTGTTGTEDDPSVEVVIVPANAASPSPMPHPNSAPPVLDVTLLCGTCDARLKVTSSKRRTQFRVTCPRCGAVSTVTMPAPTPLPVIQPAAPPVAKPIPPPVPVPVNVPLAAKPTPYSPAPPRVPPAVPKPAPPPVDLFAQALSSSGVTALPAGEHPELAKLRTFAGFGLMVAKADGRIAKAERVAVRAFLASLFAHDPALARHIDPVIEATERAIPGENEAIANVIRRSSPAEWKPLFDAATKIADSCGKRNRQETELLERIAVGLGVTVPPSVSPAAPPKPAPPPKAAEPPKPAAPDTRRVLEIEPGIELSAELIRRRFTLLFDRADPEKAAALGPEFAAMAEKKRADLRTAAETLIAAFGVPLDPPPAPPPPSDMRHNPDLDDIFG